MLNKSVKGSLANPVDINTYWIKKAANWHLGSICVTEDGNCQDETCKAAFPVQCEEEEHTLVENEVLFAAFLFTSWHYRCD
jgi:hypothetical protein